MWIKQYSCDSVYPFLWFKEVANTFCVNIFLKENALEMYVRITLNVLSKYFYRRAFNN